MASNLEPEPNEANGFLGTLEEFAELDNIQFAQEWRLKYLRMRANMIPDIARWLNILRYFHPRRLEDHWHDNFGNPLPKLYKSEGLSVEIYNFCRPIIEVYGSLLAGQKPLPFTLDVPPLNPDDEIDRFMSDGQEKVLVDELYHQKIPLHFMDFCTSVVLFGIGYVCSWVDAKTGRLKTQALPWPGDVLVQWGSDRYGSGSDGMESVILAERITLDTARRVYGEEKFAPTENFVDLRPDGTPITAEPSLGSVLLLKCWWRWASDTNGDEKIGYAVVAFDGTVSGDSEVLYREDDSGYPDIPIRWAARFATPTEPPHRSAGVLDDILGINTEYNEKLSALADLLLKLVYPKYVAKGFTPSNVPRLSKDSNMYAVGLQQDIRAIVEQVNNVPFDTFLSRLETMIFTISGLSRLMMGSMPPGDTSGEALSNLLHAAIGRLEGVRTPIQWAWTSMFDEIWVPMIRDYYKLSSKNINTGQVEDYKLDQIFGRFNRTLFVWPDVTPRDALRTAELAMNLHKASGISREGMMQRAQIPSVVDEIEKMRKERVDPILNPEDVQKTAMAKEAAINAARAERMSQMNQLPPPLPQMRVQLRGDLSPTEVQSAAQNSGIEGFPPQPNAQGGTGGAPGMPGQPMPGQQMPPPGPQMQAQNHPGAIGQLLGSPGGGESPAGGAQQVLKQAAIMQDVSRKLEASRAPILNEANNLPVPGSEESARQGVQAHQNRKR